MEEPEGSPAQQSTKLANSSNIILDSDQLGSIREQACFVVQLATVETHPDQHQSSSVSIKPLIEKYS